MNGWNKQSELDSKSHGVTEQCIRFRTHVVSNKVQGSWKAHAFIVKCSKNKFDKARDWENLVYISKTFTSDIYKKFPVIAILPITGHIFGIKNLSPYLKRKVAAQGLCVPGGV